MRIIGMYFNWGYYFVSQYESTLDPIEITKVLTTLCLSREKNTIHMDYNHLKGSPSVTGTNRLRKIRTTQSQPSQN